MIKTMYFPAALRARMLKGGPRTNVQRHTYSLLVADGGRPDFLPRNVRLLFSQNKAEARQTFRRVSPHDITGPRAMASLARSYKESLNG